MYSRGSLVVEVKRDAKALDHRLEEVSTTSSAARNPVMTNEKDK